jgi:uncharacterized coiled-coil DUF342 family protein
MANRKKQIEQIQSRAQELHDELDSLLDDMQESFDNMPENLQDSERGQTMQDRLDTLDGWRTELENIATEEVE